jgi:hypothetical protein
MLPAWLATHRAVRRLTVKDDAVAAASAVVLGSLALPASPRRDPASLDLGVLGLAHQCDQLRIALAHLDQQLIVVAEGSGCGYKLRCQSNRHCVTSSLALRLDRVAGGSALLRFGVSAERDSFA